MTCEQLMIKAGFSLAVHFCGLILVQCVGQFFVDKIHSTQKLLKERGIKPEEDKREAWNKIFLEDDFKTPTAWLGHIERFLFYFFIWHGKLELIAGWMAFKVASKWAAWQNITKIPERLSDDGRAKYDLYYLAARNQIASVTLQSFLIGTGGNIVAAILGTLLTKFLKDFLCFC